MRRPVFREHLIFIALNSKKQTCLFFHFKKASPDFTLTKRTRRTTSCGVHRAFDIGSLAARLRGHSARPANHPAIDPGDKQAAVAMILRPAANITDTEILLIRRAEREGDPWSGQMALPGGRHDPTDADLIETAVRETREEIGLDLASQAALLTCLSALPAVARAKRVGMVITPFVFVLERPGEIQTNHEVAEALWAPLGPMARGEWNTTYQYNHNDKIYDMPCFDVSGRKVWGLTHRMLSMLFDRLNDNQR